MIYFQDIVLRLHQFWASHNCLIWQPHNQVVGAGTMNPATYLRTLGPEPWKVAYVEPSVRPDDGRYGQNPNRLYTHSQYQVLLKPVPANSQELYLDSLKAIGIDSSRHDIRFVEDNWAQPAIGAWGLGWEVWLDGLEITQYTYFQQVGGIVLDPVSLELTYGLERIAMALQGVRNVFDLMWDGNRSYGDVRFQDEAERSQYAFDFCDVDFLYKQFNAIEGECQRTIRAGLVLPAHDYVLQLSNIFNLLDARGAIGVTERQRFLGRTRDLAKEIAAGYVKQRESLGYPWLPPVETKEGQAILSDSNPRVQVKGTEHTSGLDVYTSSLLLEIGVEELPARDVTEGKELLERIVPEALAEARLSHGEIKVFATPRRLSVLARDVSSRQNAIDEMVKGPSVKAGFNADGTLTQAALAFAKRLNTDPGQLVVKSDTKASYIYAKRFEEGKSALDVLSESLPRIISKLSFEKTMVWNDSRVAFPRPVQWIAALFGSQVVGFDYAGISSGRKSYGSRGEGSPEFELLCAGDYPSALAQRQVILDVDLRRLEIARQINVLAESVGAYIQPDTELLDEVTNLVEQPTALLASFDQSFLEIPAVILNKVMRSKQRYFTMMDSASGTLRPNFITVRNGPNHESQEVIKGNENVVYARFADAAFFYRYDIEHTLEQLLPQLGSMTFQAKLGSMLDKTLRIENLVESIGSQLGVQHSDIRIAKQAAHLSKADLATKMVVEMTSLQGVMGRIYHLKQAGDPLVADAIFEHYLPRFAGDDTPKSLPGLVVALADKFDSIAGLFAVGLEPKGNADPFALRRTAIGVVQCLITNHTPSFSLQEALRSARENLPVWMSDDALTAAQRFISGRHRAALLEAGYQHDIVEAILAVQYDSPYKAQRFIEQFAQAIKRDDWPVLLAAYSRCARIVKSSSPPVDQIDESELQDDDPAAQQLLKKLLSSASPTDVNNLISLMADIEPLITNFFNKVLVNVEDLTLRRMRLSLVNRVVKLSSGIVDFSKIEGF